MDFNWVAVALGDVTWIGLAFILGFFAKLIKLPPLVGFLGAGFLLGYLGYSGGETLNKIADLGITLLLFTVGLKLNFRMLSRPLIWGTASLHMAIIIAVLGMIIYSLALLEFSIFSQLDFKLAFIIAFALSFSSTVFAVKSLEEKGEMKSLHGRISIGILIMQDIGAVLFLAFATGKVPSIWALALFALIPLRPVFHYFLSKAGHGELSVLYGLSIALGSAAIFELVGVKDDVGALIIGVILASHPRSSELAKSMLSLKDLFLLGFFLSVGMSVNVSVEALLIGLIIVPLLAFKSIFMFIIMTALKLRSRTALLSTITLSNYSEFGLIVIAIAVTKNWISDDWLVIFAIALAASFFISAILSGRNDNIYRKGWKYWIRFQREQRLSDDLFLDIRGAKVVIFGMGRIGIGAYNRMREDYADQVIGVDFDIESVKKHQLDGQNVLHGDPSDPDFWNIVDHDHSLELVMLALPNLQANLDALTQLREISFKNTIAAVAKFPEEEAVLKKAGATVVFYIYTGTGSWFAEHVSAQK
jgi:predicted Kef-type K+ transport protein